MSAATDVRGTTLPTYASYKPSGVAWLPSIPVTWSMQRNGRLFAQRTETGRPDLPVLEVSLRTGVRVRGTAASDRKQALTDAARYKVAHAGDLAYNMMRMWQGAVGVVPVDGLVSPAYVVARPLDTSAPRYFDFLFRTTPFMREVENWSRGIVPDRNRLYWESFKQIQSPLPPRGDQEAIIRFLDGIDRRVRQYIAAKKKLIALSNEEKHAIIHQVVTRGLDPSVPVKPSGVEWLGDVPKHWAVAPVRRLGRVQGGKALAAKAQGSQMPYLRVANVFDGRIDGSQLNTMPFTVSEFERYRLKENDLLLNEGQSLELVGRTARYIGDPPECAFQNSLIRVQAYDHADPEFLEHLFRHAQYAGIFGTVATQTTNIAHLGVSRLANLLFAFPPLGEQRAIVEYIRGATPHLDGTIDCAYRAINYLREYRDCLIAEVITGKVDVREAAARLPQETVVGVNEDAEFDEVSENEFDSEGEEALA